MNKAIRTTFELFFIIIAVCFCFTGCSSALDQGGDNKINLTIDNINNYLIVNYTLSDSGESTSPIVTVETSKRLSDINFVDCEIEIYCKRYNDTNHSYKFTLTLDYEGKARISYMQGVLYAGDFLTIEIFKTSGYVVLK